MSGRIRTRRRTTLCCERSRLGLNPTSFTYRTVIYFLLWGLWATRIYKHSARQDKTKSLRADAHDFALVRSRTADAGPERNAGVVRLEHVAGPALVFDDFRAVLLCGRSLRVHGALAVDLLALREKGVLRKHVNVEHYHDLGKWMFALTIFWAYIAFSQYLLIWYANIPEETDWFLQRFEGTGVG